MLQLCGDNLFLLLCTISFIISLSHGIKVDSKILNVGEELQKETLPLQLGSRLYGLRGLKSHSWYEVKISFPASIPATFSLQLKRDDLGLELGKNRRLLNTEKLIFKVDSLEMISDQDGWSVLVSVEPEGIVAIPHLQEREFVTFNIAQLDVGSSQLFGKVYSHMMKNAFQEYS
ncbi:uncharacterized protein LOC110808954 isoform X2 [Carica papaya]|uniref:uncharacterized protein LOC110808954 isoform X2 n=1 Tax=Carica papaya TaxID=3649 RepID=UPI000B8CCB51|nr:uncharacterized protein LOC110808954 isoform X2 [Carica papaya]XP_021890329.1 uncharacterized protein LOC110808954 isoform X2 [Carica papaya]